MRVFLLAPWIIATAIPAAHAEPTLPRRQIPPPVLVELQQLDNKFELALASDCDAATCYAKGCTYVDHATTDQPRKRSMPGLSWDEAPGSVEAQDFLTRANCSFAHESTLSPEAAGTLARRLQTRLSNGWTVVNVERQLLPAMPPPEETAPQTAETATTAVPPAAPTEPAPLTRESAIRDVWTALLPHLYWMVGIGLVTAAAATLVWAWRRVGRAAVDETIAIAEVEAPEPVSAAPETTDAEREAAYVAEQEATWRARMAMVRADAPDPELQTLVRDRLRAGDLAFLAKAAHKFPKHFPAAFPNDGETAIAKLELAEMIQNADPSSLPSDAAFFEALTRHALAAALSAQNDARIVRVLREEFGPAGLVDLIGRLAPRMGALVFAMAPAPEQYEMLPLLAPAKIRALSEQLLASNRMDPAETHTLFEVLRASRGEVAVPAPFAAEVTDRGTTFDAAGALAALLPRLDPSERAGLFSRALARFNGGLPTWYREIFVPDMIFALPPEARADLLLEREVEPLAAWVSLADRELVPRLLASMPESLRASLRASSQFPSRARQLALASRGRRDLARGFQRQLTRAGLSFEQVVCADAMAVA